MHRIYRIIYISGLLIASGCATHPQSLAHIEEALYAGDFAAADTLILQEKALAQGKDRLLFYLHTGLITHLNGEYGRSNSYFDLADARFDELYTKSVTSEAAALLVNDMARAYSGEDYEKVMIHYYMALNYLQLGELDDALVECRRVNVKLEEMNQKYDAHKNVYQADAFIHYLMGMIYEAAGEVNNAFIAYRNAADVYERDYAVYYGLNVPEQLADDVLRTAQALGFSTELERYKQKWGKTAWTAPQEHQAQGEVILIWDNGQAPYKDQDALEIALDNYYLRVAFPRYVPRPPRFQQAVLEINSQRAGTFIVQDISGIAIKNLQDRAGRTMARATVRSVAKYALKEKVEDEWGEAAGCLFNMFAAATEQADTRSWFTLPDNIQIARLLCPPGVHNARLQFKDSRGSSEQMDVIRNVNVRAGRITFISYRTFQ